MRNNNKILFLLHLPPPVHGSSMVGQIIKESGLISNSFQTRYINLLISRTVRESGKTNISKIIRFSVSWIKLLFELIIGKPDLCYFALSATESAFYKDVLLVSLLKIFRVKIVFHLHNKGIKKREFSKIDSWLYRFVFKNSNVILLSLYLYEDINTFVSRQQVYVCPNGVESLLRTSKNQLDIVSKPVKILFLSNLIKSKGVFTLIEACRILQQNDYDFTCDFVGGEGDIYAAQFQAEVKEKGLTNKVEYLGKKYGSDKDAIYRQSDIFVLPTFYPNECFPLVLLEAMQYELPVVSTNEGGIRDIVEDKVTGFLVEQNNPAELADKLATLIDNEAMRLEMGRAGHAKYKKEFTLQAFESKLQGILEHVLLKDSRKEQ